MLSASTQARHAACIYHCHVSNFARSETTHPLKFETLEGIRGLESRNHNLLWWSLLHRQSCRKLWNLHTFYSCRIFLYIRSQKLAAAQIVAHHFLLWLRYQQKTRPSQLDFYTDTNFFHLCLIKMTCHLLLKSPWLSSQENPAFVA